jgi:hypothetical protein
MGADARASDFVALGGYIISQAVAHVLKQCGDELTRDNILKQATNLKNQRFKMHLLGVTLTDSPENYESYTSCAWQNSTAMPGNSSTKDTSNRTCIGLLRKT